MTLILLYIFFPSFGLLLLTFKKYFFYFCISSEFNLHLSLESSSNYNINYILFLLNGKSSERSSSPPHNKRMGSKNLRTMHQIHRVSFIYNLAPVKQCSIITNQKRYGQDRKNIFIKSVDGCKRIVSVLLSSGLSPDAEWRAYSVNGKREFDWATIQKRRRFWQ